MVSPELRDKVQEILSCLPETATLADLIYALEVHADISAGLADAKAGRVIAHNLVKQRFGLD